MISTADTGAAVVADYDGRLMTRIESGSVDAFDELHDRYSARAYRVARWVCQEDGPAEDAVQEAFMSIWRSRTEYQPARTVAAWLLTTVCYRAIDIVRRNTKHAERPAGEQALGADLAPGDIAEQTATRDEVHRLHAPSATGRSVAPHDKAAQQT